MSSAQFAASTYIPTTYIPTDVSTSARESGPKPAPYLTPPHQISFRRSKLFDIIVDSTTDT